MKKLLVLLLISINFSAIAEWKYISENVNGADYYVDFEKISKQGENIYFWYLTDYSKRDKFGDFSNIGKSRGNCTRMGHQWMQVYYYSAPMGKGKINASDAELSAWKYPPPNSIMETVLKSVCDYVN